MNYSAAMSKDRMIHEAQRISLNMQDMEVSTLGSYQAEYTYKLVLGHLPWVEHGEAQCRVRSCANYDSNARDHVHNQRRTSKVFIRRCFVMGWKHSGQRQ